MRGVTQRSDGSVRVRIRAHDGKTREKTFKGATPEVNLRRAKAWRAKQKGVKEETDLPEGINRKRRKTRDGATYFVLEARVAAWADPARPRRCFPEDALEEAAAWLERANNAREAGLSLPEPRPRTQTTPVSAAPGEAVLFGVAAKEAFTSYYEERIAAGRVKPEVRDSALRKLNKWVIPALGSYPLDAISREEHVIPLRDKLANKGYAVNYQKLTLWQIRRVFRYAAAKGWCQAVDPTEDVLPRLPAAKEKKQKPGKPLARDKSKHPPIPPATAARIAERFMSAGDDEYARAVLVLRYCGLRVGELFGLVISDVHADRRYLSVTKQGGRRFRVFDSEEGKEKTVTRVAYTKTAYGRRLVPVMDALWPFIEQQVEHRMDAGAAPGDLLFAGPAGALEGGLQSHFRNHLMKVTTGLVQTKDGNESYFLPHDFRHAVSTDLLYAGATDPQRAKFLGHSRKENSGETTVTTVTYEHNYIDFDDDDSGLVSVDRVSEFTEPTDYEVMLAQVAEKLNLHVKTRLNGAPLVAESVHNSSQEWVSIAEAAEILGRSLSTVRNLIYQGKLPIQKGYKRSTRTRWKSPRIWVSRSAVEEMGDSRSQLFSLSEISRLLTAQRGEVFPVWVLKRVIERNGLVFVNPEERTANGGARRCLTKDDYEKLLAIIKKRDEFLDTHWTISDASRALGTHYYWVDRCVSAGIIKPVEPPVVIAEERQKSLWLNKEETWKAWEATKPAPRAKRPKKKKVS